MSEPTDPDERPLRLVEAQEVPTPPDVHVDDEAAGEESPEPRDALLARAERIADLPLSERPAAFDGLNRAVVAELNSLEEG